jgi:Ubiquitin family
MSTDPLQAHATPQPAPAADETIDSAYIDLIILSPSSEVINNGRMSYPKIALDTTIAQLRDRIQNDLPARPSPQQQRLIYRGRPLLHGELTLRQIFRGQVGYALTFKSVTNISYSKTLPNTLPAIPSIWFSRRAHQRMLLSVARLPRP